MDFKKVVSLVGDASTRKYFRLLDNRNHPFIAVTYEQTEAGRKSFERFIFWQKKYKDLYIPVPEIFHIDEIHLTMILEDLGSKSLLSEISKLPSNEQNLLLDEAINLVLPLHQLKVTDQGYLTQGIFNREKLDFELNLTINHFSQTFGLPSLKTNQKVIQEIWSEFLSQCFNEKDYVWCHRDFHAKNLMLDSQNKLRPIDFQDTMLGPITYDLCSLLHDCYINYSESTKEFMLKKMKASKSFKNFSDDFEEQYYITMAQRTFKAIGSFCYVFQARQNYFYLRHVGLAMEHFNFALKKINNNMSKELQKLIVNPYVNL
ncbi:MAG: phosphotransferase [Bacteriovoracaceae bacterium]|nr:phosphotransferase [Bacteriovoracaceae bacterium]